MKETPDKITSLGSILKPDLKMKLTYLFLFLGLFQMNAHVYSQDVKVSLEIQGESLKKVFNTIEKKTDYHFFYSKEEIDTDRKIFLTVKQKKVSEILTQIFKGRDIAFKLYKKQIVLLKEKESKKTLQTSNQQHIQGTVTSSKNGMPLIGATVRVKGASTGTTTNFDGAYSLEINDPEAILIFSYLGYQSKEIPVNGQQIINAVLTMEAGELEEIVLVGYGQQKRSEVTGAVSSIESEKLDQISTGTVGLGRAMGGLAKGVRISQNTGSPGSPIRINIRGFTSPLSGSLNQPLFVIDGVPFNTDATSGNPLLTINTNSILSVDILKDAAATSIYGSRGANGVIIIKTRRGERNQKPQVHASISSTYSSPINTLDALDAKGYRAFNNLLISNSIAAINKGRVPFFYGFDLANIGKVTLDPTTSKFTYDGLSEDYFGDANTDWNDEVYRDMAVTRQINFGINGGAENTNYAFGISTTDQQGLNLSSELESYNIHMALDSDISDAVTTGGVFNFSHTKINSGNFQLGLPTSSSIYGARPDLPVRDENGELLAQPSYAYGFPTYKPNPVMSLQHNNIDKSYNFIGNSYFEVEPIDDLKLRTEVSAAVFYNDIYNYTPKTTMENFGVPNESYLIKDDNLTSNITTNLTANYHFNIADHDFSLLAGYSWDRTKSKYHSYSFIGFPDDEVLVDVNSAERSMGYGSGSLESGINSLFARLTYGYKNIYNATLNFRTDKSSKFGPGNKRGYFPSASVSWNLANADFLKESKDVDNLKLRVSYGKVGSANIADFAYLQFFSTSSQDKYGGNTAINPSNTLPNRNVQWETTLGANIGLDFAFFDHRLSGSIDVYDRQTTGALAPTPIPLELGPSVYYSNLMDVSNQGVEIRLGGDIIKTSDFTWSADINWAFNRNTLEDLHGANINQYSLDYYVEGEPVGTIKGYKVVKILASQQAVDALNSASPTGLYDRPSLGVGDYMFADLNKDGLINTDDRTVIGSIEPEYFGGFSNTFSYKNISLSAFFQYSVGGEAIWSAIRNQGYNTLGQNKLVEYAKNTWTPENPNAKYARAIYTDPSSNTRTSDKYLFSTSYLRLKSIQLAYDFNETVLNKLSISNASVFISGSNLLTWTKWPGTDPEISSNSGGITNMTHNADPYPLAKSISLGIQVQF